VVSSRSRYVVQKGRQCGVHHISYSQDDSDPAASLYKSTMTVASHVGAPSSHSNLILDVERVKKNKVFSHIHLNKFNQTHTPAHPFPIHITPSSITTSES
jgi:hypothetical protein